MPVLLTETELEYVKAHPLARLATASPEGEPDVAPCLCIFNHRLGAFLTGGMGIERTRRYNNGRRNARFSAVFDDLTWEPYSPRGVKVAGSLDVIVSDDEVNLGRLGVHLLVLRPERTWSWGLDGPAMDANGFSLSKDGGPTTPL